MILDPGGMGRGCSIHQHLCHLEGTGWRGIEPYLKISSKPFLSLNFLLKPSPGLIIRYVFSFFLPALLSWKKS